MKYWVRFADPQSVLFCDSTADPFGDMSIEYIGCQYSFRKTGYQFFKISDCHMVVPYVNYVVLHGMCSEW